MRQRSVASRILLSYLVVLSLFLGASSWSVVTFRQAAAEAALLRQGYLPLALSVRDLVSSQDTWNSQLNHVTTARNPRDAQVWFDTALAVGRPQNLKEVLNALERALPQGVEENDVPRDELLRMLERAFALARGDSVLLSEMFSLLSRGDEEEAQIKRDALVVSGLRVQRKLGKLEGRVRELMDDLVQEARRREETTLQVLVLLGGVTFLVGILMALYASRVLKPLSSVTKRAAAVAAGDLSVQKAIDSGDEIGELSATFEGMVRAIADAREKVLASERLAAIGKMAAHVTHEVRNPLSSIALNLELLEEEISPQDEESRSLLSAIGQEVSRLARLSDQYLSMARRKTPLLEEADIGALVKGSVSFMRPEIEGHGLVLSVDVEKDLPWVSVDEGQVRQALFNLVRNAREAMPEGGIISISAKHHESQVVIAIADTGPGVPPEQVEKLFDPFFTTKDHGTGLGLAVTREILKAHGGKLEYQSVVPHGSCFEMHLPLAQNDENLEKNNDRGLS